MSFPRVRVRKERKRLELTIPQAAARTKGVVSSRTWGEAERGGRNPSWEKGEAMIRAVGLVVKVKPDE